MSASKVPTSLSLDDTIRLLTPDRVDDKRFPLPYAFRPEEAAAYVRLNRNDIHNFIHAGELRAMKVGSRTLIKREDLEALVTEKAVYRVGYDAEGLS